MDKGNDRGRTGHTGREDDRDLAADWPQRPPRPRPEASGPRLDPPGSGQRSPANRTSAGGQRPRPEAEDLTKETQILPVVEPSRFERDNTRAQPRVTPRPQVPGQMPVQPPRPTSAGPYGRPPAPRRDWQQEQELEGYTVDDEEYGLTPPARQAPRVQPQGKTKYISADVEKAPRRRAGWVLWLLAGLLGLAAVITVAFSLAWQGQYAGKVYAGVTVLDTDLGGMTQDEARKLLNDKVQEFVRQPVVLRWAGKEWRPSADQIGMSVDVNSTVNEAFSTGRSGDMFSNVAQQWSAAQAGYTVPLTVQLSEPELQAYLDTISGNEINQELFEGDVRLNGTEIVALAGKEGRTLQTYEAIRKIREAVAMLEPAEIELPVTIVQPAVSAQEVGYVQGLLEVRISGPITATAPGGKVFALDREALVRFTTIERNPDRTASRHVELGWRDNELKILADRWAKEATRAAQNARFAWNGGAVAVLSESVEGFEPDAGAIIGSIKESAGTSDRREFALPGLVVAPVVSSKDIGALGINGLMGEGVSTFKGSSPERATNIRVAAELLNGAVVPPGGTFSFLETMGGIDEAHGFVEGYVIAAERTQLGVGGGVCQVSTTAFRAAFWSGVDITERNQHSYRVGWYEAGGEPVGFDAAVFDPGVDLKFVNNTPGYILVEARTGPDSLTVSMYGTKLPGEVKLEGPAIANRVPPPADVYEVDPRLPAGSKKQVETARAGLDTTITRRIVVPGQPDRVDQFHSSYKAWPNWYIVASASQIPGGTGTVSTQAAMP